MAIITGTGSDFGRLVVEEYLRREQRVVALGQAAPATAVDETAADHTGNEATRRAGPDPWTNDGKRES